MSQIKKPTSSIESITYRNAVYQGGIDKQRETRSDFGIVYIAKTHEFICCDNWVNDQLSGNSLFFNEDQQYAYGHWKDSRPNGFNVFRCEDSLLFAYFTYGTIQKGERLVVLFEKYNMGFIMVVTEEGSQLQDTQFQLQTKREVFSSTEIGELFDECQWPEDIFSSYETLIRYLSFKLIPQSLNKQLGSGNRVKLRLLQNKYFRYGYDEGLAIIFDENFNRRSIGHHIKAEISSFGVSYTRHHQNQYIEEGLFNRNEELNQVFAFPSTEKDKVSKRIAKLYSTNLLMGLNFCNGFFKNPSKSYLYHVRNIICGGNIRIMLEGSLTMKGIFDSEDEQSLGVSKISMVETDQEMEYSINGKKRRELNCKNQLLNDTHRLQEIKQQVYNSIERRKHTDTVQVDMFPPSFEQRESRHLINMERINENGSHIRYRPIDFNQRVIKSPAKNLSRSRSRKRIFEESDKNWEVLKKITPEKIKNRQSPFRESKKKKNNREQVTIVSRSQQKNFDHQNQNSDENQNLKSISDQISSTPQNRQIYDGVRSKQQKVRDEMRQRSNIKQRQQRRQRTLNKSGISRVSASDLQKAESKQIQNKSDKQREDFSSKQSKKQFLYVPITIDNSQIGKSQNSVLRSRLSKNVGEEINFPSEGQVKDQHSKSKVTFDDENVRNLNPSKLNEHQTKSSSKLKLSKDLNSSEKHLEKEGQSYHGQEVNQRGSRQLMQKHSNQVYVKSEFGHSQVSQIGKFRHPKKHLPVESRQNSIYQQEQEQSQLGYASPYITRKTGSPYREYSPLQKPSKSPGSYSKRFQQKKLIEEEIERSPDRKRCYGNNLQNSPYLRDRSTSNFVPFTKQKQNRHNNSTYTKGYRYVNSQSHQFGYGDQLLSFSRPQHFF